MIEQVILFGLGFGVGAWRRWRGLAIVLIIVALYVGAISIGGYLQYGGSEEGAIALPALIVRQYHWIVFAIVGALAGAAARFLGTYWGK